MGYRRDQSPQVKKEVRKRIHSYCIRETGVLN